MIRSFGNKTAEDIFHGFNTKEARRLPRELWSIAIRKLDQINAAAKLSDLKIPPGNKLETLKRDLMGHYSIRINDQYRIVFRWIETEAFDVSILDYH